MRGLVSPIEESSVFARFSSSRVLFCLVIYMGKVKLYSWDHSVWSRLWKKEKYGQRGGICPTKLARSSLVPCTHDQIKCPKKIAIFESVSSKSVGVCKKIIWSGFGITGMSNKWTNIAPEGLQNRSLPIILGSTKARVIGESKKWHKWLRAIIILAHSSMF